MKPASYDLRHEPWIPVRDSSGDIATLGLIELLRRAHEYQSLALSNPLDTVSLYRVLIVLSHCILGDPETIEDWIKAFDRGRFIEDDVTDYFERHSDRFDIFHPDYPFMQTAGLVQQDKSGQSAPAMAGALLAEVASGNNKTLFSHDIDDTPRALTKQEATYALIRAQYFALGGIAKKYSNLFPYQANFLQAPLVGGTSVLVFGDTLFETLLLNTVPRHERTFRSTNAYPVKDQPVWERDSDQRIGPEVVPDGYLDYLTLKARHLRLQPGPNADTSSVTHVHMTEGIRPKVPEMTEPMFYWRVSKQNRWYAPQLSSDRALWRDSAAILAYRDNLQDSSGSAVEAALAVRFSGVLMDSELPWIQDRAVGIGTYALANDQANPLLWRTETIAVPSRFFSDLDLYDTLLDAISHAQSAGRAVAVATSTFYRALLDPSGILDGPPPKSLKDAIKERTNSCGVFGAYWSALDQAFREFVSQMDQPDALRVWDQSVRQAADRAFEMLVVRREIGLKKAYRARTIARRVLRSQLKKILTQLDTATEEVK